MDPQGILNVAAQLSLPTLGLVVLGGMVWGSIKVVGWGNSVTTLLGNHLRHDLSTQTEALQRIEATLNSLESSANEQTLVLRALGRMLMEHQTGRREF